MQRLYPADIFESLWDEIDTFIQSGIIFSSEEVLDEIKKGDDNLVDWAKERKDIFLESDEEVQNIVKIILRSHAALITGSRRQNDADPFVIALAKKTGYKLVTDERRSGGNQPPKIPNVCDDYDIECINFNDFLRENQVKI